MHLNYKYKLAILPLLVITLSACGDSKLNKPLITASLNDMALVPAATYLMGSKNSELMEQAHSVTLSTFYISKYNVSYKKYDLYSEVTGKEKIDKDDISIFRYADHPVDNLTWYQANDYCQHLKQITGLPYDLPTEAQWEYVARNDGKRDWFFPTNNGKQELGKNFPSYEQYKDQQKNMLNGVGPLSVGSLPCTPQGICGLAGEVNEWVKNWYGSTDPHKAGETDPQGPATGTLKTIRGGGAEGSPEYNNSFGRAGQPPNKQWAGFRCVINSDKPMSELKSIAMKHLQ